MDTFRHDRSVAALKRRRVSGVAGTVVRLLERFIGLLEIPTPDPDQVFRRITMMERDISCRSKRLASP